jgi:2-polyprenyl-3-methyl-5-hydroxy-6-metoxy-1,4-benzoquinol methylase
VLSLRFKNMMMEVHMKSVAVAEPVHEESLYEVDARTRGLLIESAPLMAKWARTECHTKPIGGMEEWANAQGHAVDSCDWYHSTWQYLRLLNMVAVPPWYKFYNKAVSSLLRKRPNPSVLISGAADFGMLATVHQAIEAAGVFPKITIYDICTTPLLSCRWYAERHGFDVRCVCDNLITTTSAARGGFDLIVTDELLTVLRSDDKRAMVRRWKELLKPGGAVVTTAMVGGPTTADLRRSYAARARLQLDAQGDSLRSFDATREELVRQFDRFATFHTRYMFVDANEIRDLFSDFYLGFCVPTETPGECVNPTTSFQIIASVPFAGPAQG